MPTEPLHYRLPHTFQSACGFSPLPSGIRWTSLLGNVTCDACKTLVKEQRVPSRDRQMQLADHFRHDCGDISEMVMGFEAQLLAAHDQFTQHTKAVGDFLNELFAILVDPLADGTITVADLQVKLLASATQARERENTRMNVVQKLRALIQWQWHESHDGGDYDRTSFARQIDNLLRELM